MASLNSSFTPFAGDSVAFKAYSKNRVVGNVQLDYSFSEKHSLFARISTNAVNENKTMGGGYKSNSNIIDIELQDNIQLGAFNSFSIGANYRNVNYDLSGFSDINSIMFVNPNNTESLKGVFIQDKISLMEGKLNFYLGIKAENFSLIDDNYYLSPMAKFSFIPTENMTFWGGYTQSYTTPGYNQTNIEFNVFRAESPKVFFDAVGASALLPVYEGLVDGGMSHSDAIDALPLPEDLKTQIKLFPGYYNTAIINGASTKPTSFKNFELGFRIQAAKKISFETNFFYSIMSDGIGNSPTPMGIASSLVRPGETIQAFYYGNYLKGTNMGLESVLKLFPTNDLMFELSHSWYKYTLEYQENADFDIGGLSDSQKDLVEDKYKQVPEHILRAKVYYTLNNSWKFSFSTLYASSFFVKLGTARPTYQKDLQRFDPIYGDGGNQSLVGGEHDNRLILNIRIDKYLLHHKLGIFIYGNDITAGAFTEGIIQFETIYPRQVGAMFGAGVSYRIE